MIADPNLNRVTMMRWLLLAGQLILGFAMLPQVLLFGSMGLAPVLITLFEFKNVFAPFPFFSLRSLAIVALASAGLFVTAASFLCFFSAASLFRGLSRRGLRLSVAAAICYWVFLATSFVAGLTEFNRPDLRGNLQQLANGRNLPIGIATAVISYGVYRLCLGEDAQSPEGRTAGGL